MNINRKGEDSHPPLRSSRIFSMESVWYFSTREGVDVGPFNSQYEANSNLKNFIEFIQLANKKTLKLFLSTLNIQHRQDPYR
jgi:hypothetical protein